VEGSSEETADLVGVAISSNCAADGGSWCAVDGEIGSPDVVAETSSEETAGVVGASDDVTDSGCWSEVDGEIGKPAEVVEGL